MLKDLDMTVEEANFLSRCKQNTHYIAGGYLRDSLLGRPIKDIDLFVDVSKRSSVQVERSLTRLIAQPWYTPFDGEYDSSMFHTVGTVKDTRINLIIPKTSFEEHFETFDLGLCKIYYNVVEDKLVQHEDFIRDVDNKTLTRLKPINDLCFSHLARVESKYPDYVPRYRN